MKSGFTAGFKSDTAILVYGALFLNGTRFLIHRTSLKVDTNHITGVWELRRVYAASSHFFNV